MYGVSWGRMEISVLSGTFLQLFHHKMVLEVNPSEQLAVNLRRQAQPEGEPEK